MPRVRVVLAALPTMLAEIVREALASHPDLEVVAEVRSRAALWRLLPTTHVAAAIIGLDEGESPLDCAALLRAHPGLAVLAISVDGRTAYHCTMRMLVSVTTELSTQQLLDALRAEGVDRDLHLFSAHWPISAAASRPDN